MKYIVLIIDGAADLPLPGSNMKTCLELANTPNLDKLSREGLVGMARTVPKGMEPSSACACMSIMGYEPKIYFHGRSGIEAISMGYPIADGEVGFRCNLVSIQNGLMHDYSAGHIKNAEASALIQAIQNKLGSDTINFYAGLGYRHLCKIKDHSEALQADCTPPHDIPDKPIREHFPKGPGSNLLRELMMQSVDILSNHPINKQRESRGEPSANMIWLFWGSGKTPHMPQFKTVYNLQAAITSGVDLLRGLAKICQISILDIPGVTDGPDNDYKRQASDALTALDKYDLVFIHVESPDEAGHSGNINAKVEAIEHIDHKIVSQLVSYRKNELRILAIPDHPTPIEVRTHTSDPVPFVLWGTSFKKSGASAFSEREAKRTGIFIENGYKIIERLIQN